jgi:hypothetical protein
MTYQHNLGGIGNNSADRLTVRMHLQKFAIPKLTTTLGDALARVMLASKSGLIYTEFGSIAWETGRAISCLSYSVELKNGQ